MKYRCVSYPELEPNQVWLRKILLFVDEIHRIVPVGEEIRDSDDLKELMEVCPDAVHSCPPSWYVETSGHQRELFARALDQPKFLTIASAKNVHVKFAPSGRIEIPRWEFLHIEKIGSGVREELERRAMLRAIVDSSWLSVPQGVGDLVLSMVADKIAENRGFDAITDRAMPFALGALHQCTAERNTRLDGIVASAVASVLVPKYIGLLTPNEYAELRKRHTGARQEYARMVHELRSDSRLDRVTEPKEFQERLQEITLGVERELEGFRKSKIATTINDWVPLSLTSLIPVGVAAVFGPIPGTITGLFSFAVNAAAKVTKETMAVRYPKVLQALCSAKRASADAALKYLTVGNPAAL